NVAYQVGVRDDKGQRRTMEDAYSFVVDFARVRGQGYFAVFDGHAGKYAAEWCGQHFHEYLLAQLHANPGLPVPDVLNNTFHAVDFALSTIAQQNDKMHSGCTAVTAFLRIEDGHGGQSFLEGLDVGEASETSSTLIESPANDSQSLDAANAAYPTPDPSTTSSSPSPSPRSDSPTSPGKKKNSGSKLVNKKNQVITAIKSLASSNPSIVDDTAAVPPEVVVDVITPPLSAQLRRVLYTANAGDARAVLCRGGRAVRLTYDHKGSDKQEARRITDAGGFVMSGRVNGVLAVTRSLGDSSMKDFVVGSPYTTETELSDDDEFLIIACDGVWDIATDQEAVDIVRRISDPQEAARVLVEHALQESTDNITVIVVRLLPQTNA
ncbi:hypothetical protein M0805_004952, partial [Coniferiporia weirii]